MRLLVHNPLTPYEIGVMLALGHINAEDAERLRRQIHEGYEELTSIFPQLVRSRIMLNLVDTGVKTTLSKILEICYPPHEEETTRKIVEAVSKIAKIIPIGQSTLKDMF